MTTAYIKFDEIFKTFTFMLRANHYRPFPRSVKTAEHMIKFLSEGGFDPPSLQFMSANDKPIRRYAIGQRGEFTTATVDLDTTKRLHIQDAWSKADQLRWLRMEAIDLPKEYDNLKSALDYLQEQEAFTVTAFQEELAARRTAGIKQFCEHHASELGQGAVVEFEAE